MENIKIFINNQDFFANRKLLDKKVKAKWLRALRSNKYEKGKQYLCRDNKFCCLGVLNDLLKIPFEDLGSFHVERYYQHSDKILSDSHPLNEVLSSSGSFTGFHIFINNEEFLTLAGVNDSTETFAEVIYLIKNYF